jgi:hypothetical protein
MLRATVKQQARNKELPYLTAREAYCRISKVAESLLVLLSAKKETVVALFPISENTIIRHHEDAFCFHAGVEDDGEGPSPNTRATFNPSITF